MSMEIPGVEDAATSGGIPGIDLDELTSMANALFSVPPGSPSDGPLPAGRAALGRADLPTGFSPPPPGVPQVLADVPHTPNTTPNIGAVDSTLAAAPSPGRTPEAPSVSPGRSVPVSGDLSELTGNATGIPAGPAPTTVPQVTSTGIPGQGDFYFLNEAASTLPSPGAVPGLEPTPLRGESSLQELLTVLPNLLSSEPRPLEHQQRYFLPSPPEEGATSGSQGIFDVATIRRDFPILSERINGRQVTWLDNAATTQKPRVVIDRLSYFYEHENSNIHRAAHDLAARATDAYEEARNTVARYLGAGSADEIVFVRGTTEGINLIAGSWGRQNIHEGDEIVISHLEHHANIVPWQQLVAATGAVLKVIPVDDDGQILLDEYQRLLSDRTKLVSVTQVSNALGTVTPITEVIAMAHQVGACAVVDGAQSVSHMRVDVVAMDADFFVFSGHKIYGPTGIGAVYAKQAIWEAMPPWQTGGNMINDVTLQHSTFQDPPMRFEAGTGNIADAVGLGAALRYVEGLGIENIARYEHDLLGYATQGMLGVPGLTMIGTAKEKASVLSFILDGYTTEQVGEALSDEGIAVRSGHHCAQPILRRFGLNTTVRPSIAFYNTTEEMDHLVSVLHRLVADSGGGRR
jgi:cysteine desulfurase / selenocysteine lyase